MVHTALIGLSFSFIYKKRLTSVVSSLRISNEKFQKTVPQVRVAYEHRTLHGFTGMKLVQNEEFARYPRVLNVTSITIVFFVLFIIANPKVSLNFNNAVLTSVPIIILLTLLMVFVVASDEIDLPFGSIMRSARLAFAYVTTCTASLLIGLIACFATAALWGFVLSIISHRYGLERRRA